MNDVDTKEALEFFANLLRSSEDRQSSIDRTYFGLRDLGLLSKVIVHRYQCKRGCQIAQAYSHGGRVFLSVRDYKYSRGMNEASSVPRAREKNTLDGDRHWPAHVYDMTQLAEWGDDAGAQAICRHYKGLLTGSRVLRDADGVLPGRGGKPTTLDAP